MLPEIQGFSAAGEAMFGALGKWRGWLEDDTYGTIMGFFSRKPYMICVLAHWYCTIFGPFGIVVSGWRRALFHV